MSDKECASGWHVVGFTIPVGCSHCSRATFSKSLEHPVNRRAGVPATARGPACSFPSAFADPCLVDRKG